MKYFPFIFSYPGKYKTRNAEKKVKIENFKNTIIRIGKLMEVNKISGSSLFKHIDKTAMPAQTQQQPWTTPSSMFVPFSHQTYQWERSSNERFINIAKSSACFNNWPVRELLSPHPRERWMRKAWKPLATHTLPNRTLLAHSHTGRGVQELWYGSHLKSLDDLIKGKKIHTWKG